MQLVAHSYHSHGCTHPNDHCNASRVNHALDNRSFRFLVGVAKSQCNIVQTFPSRQGALRVRGSQGSEM
eukprot:COSAG02_NODE_40815_length_401_cov_0.847682_1_plen_68_part_01